MPPMQPVAKNVEELPLTQSGAALVIFQKQSPELSVVWASARHVTLHVSISCPLNENEFTDSLIKRL